MRKTTFKPQVTTLLSIAAGQQLEAIIVEGKVFIEYPTPVGSIGDTHDAGILKEAVSPKETKEDATKSTGTKKVAEAKKAEYDEKELMEMTVSELKDIIEEMGIEIPKEGKDTNKKLRLLILDEQENEEEEEEAPTKSAAKKSGSKKEVEEEEESDDDDDDISADLTDIFTKFDEGETEEEDVVKALIKLGYEKADAKEILDDFLNDDDISVADYVEHLVSEDAEEEEEVEEEEEEAPAPKRGGKAKEATTAPAKKGGKAKEDFEVVEIADLTKGDKVSVYFKSDKEFVNGEVKSILRGKVTVLFDDDSTEVLNAKENTEIRLVK